MRRYLVAILVALLVVFLLTSTVSAHHPVVSADASCVAPDGSYDVEWTVEADQVRGLSWSLGGAFQPDSEPFVFVTVHNVSEEPPFLSLDATWSNGATGTFSGSTPKPELCPQASTTTTTTELVATTEPPIPPSTTTPPSPSLPATGKSGAIVWLAATLIVIGFLMVDRKPRLKP